ncbi:hypothetical protein EG68_07255 [Paragonimus skrjabini miyazakii]|uniref:Actin interacting protein 3-like C-terminal domain-containing protein n=1 Tax=Paragonimus skrjabini miyazakii TaxID=59628 RepID=A0A8S9YNA6_9TREM|nr:hypothetical protein EG68_07255 [Paragonimus skrjabini miyazakii]
MSTQPQPQHLSNPSNQPVLYLAVQGSKTPKPTVPEGTGNGQSPVLAQPTAGQICTCPPQVHKALLEGQLISHAGTQLNFGSDRIVQLLQLYKPVLAIPSDPKFSLSPHELQLLRTIKIPEGQMVLTPNSTTGSAQYVLLPASVNPPTQTITKEVGAIPDILSEKGKPEQQMSCVDQLKVPGSDSHIRIACMKSQLAHLSAWVRLLQQNPEAANQSMQIVGHSHSHCDDDFCRVMEANQSSLTGSTEAGSLFYTPSSSSLDSAYSAKSTTSSESSVQHLDQSVQREQKTNKRDLLKDNTERHSPRSVAEHPPSATYSTVPSDSSNPCSNCSELFLLRTNEHNTKLKLIRESLQLTQNDLRKVKQELDVLRRMYSATVNANHECTCDAMEKIRQLLTKSELIKTYPIQSTRTELDREIVVYREATENAISWLNDLELAIEDMRISALTRRCYVDLPEVECLSTHLQRVTCRLKNIQSEFPKFSSQLQKVLNIKMSVIKLDKEFLISDSDRLECALRRCKDLSNTLFTLKRLGYVQEHDRNLIVPYIRTVPEPSQEDREQLMREIQTVTTMSDRRMTSIQAFENLQYCRRRLKDIDVTKHLEDRCSFFSLSEPHPRHYEFASTETHVHENMHIRGQQTCNCELQALPVTAPNVNENINASEDGNGQSVSETFQYLKPKTERHHVTLKNNLTLQKQPVNDICSFCCRSSAEAFTASVEPTQDHIPLAPVSWRREKTHTPPIMSSSESIECCADKQDDAIINPVNTIPTILKRNSTRQSPQSELKRSSKHNPDANRRSRVVFSRTVLVSNGSETTQLNFPSDTDEESGRIYPEGARHTVDDMVINRTSQPWIMSIRKGRGVHRPISYNEYAPVQSNLGTAVRGTHTPKYKRSVANHEPLHIRTALNTESADLEISAHRNQRHHHNCQKIRHTSNQYASKYNSLK